MAFTVSDFQDLLRVLQEHPEWRVDLRRHVLSDDLIELPAVVRDLAEAQRQTETRLTELAEAQRLTETRLTELAEAQRLTETRLTELAEAQRQTEARLSELVGRFDALAGAVAQVETHLGTLAGRVGRMNGRLFEMEYVRKAPAYFGRILRRLRIIEPTRLANLLDDAVELEQMSPADRGNALLADLVLSSRRLDDNAEVYFVVEISIGIGVDDVRRAIDRAAIMAKLGRPAVAVVAGASIDPQGAAVAEAHHVLQVLDGRAA